MKIINLKPKSARKLRLSMTVYFSLAIFIIQAISIVIATILAYVFSSVGWIDFGLPSMPDLTELLIFMAISSLVIGFSVAFLTVKYPLKPFTTLIGQINRLAAGDYKARVQFGKRMDSHPAVKDVIDSFNTMAEELEGVEMLRTDFINNFSHEFKTPIVSIAGFAKLIKRGNLTEEQKSEYIDIIEEESLRLAEMANNVLNLTKVENQLILTDVSKFNLSEQIRGAVLLLENKWVKKNTILNLDVGEVEIEANEELLKQVWINLIDNAIKFSPNGAQVEIKIIEKENLLSVSVINSGSYIEDDELKKIFNKFYQADTSHSSEGNGIGLAIVKKIIELHGGEISVESSNSITEFTVFLPKTQ